MAMDGIGTDEEAIYEITENATILQQREILENPALVARLRDDLTAEEMLKVLDDLDASLPDRLAIALDAGDSATVISLLDAADDDARLLTVENTALVARMQGEMSEAGYAQVCELLGLPVPNAAVAGVPEEADAGTDTGDARLGEHGTGEERAEAGEEGAEPEGPETLVGKISDALDQSPPDGAAALRRWRPPRQPIASISPRTRRCGSGCTPRSTRRSCCR